MKLNPTCPICQTPLETVTAWIDGDQVIILLTCANGHEQAVEVPVSRFVEEADAQAKLNAYAAYVAGKITLKELEDVVNA